MQSLLWIPLALLSAAFAALVAIFGKMGIEKVDSTVATTIRAAIMFLTMLALTLATGKISGISGIRDKALLFIVLAGVAGALSWIFYFWALKVGKASQVAPLDRLSVLFVIVLAALFLGEKIGWKTGVGALIMTVGAVLVALG